MQLVDYILTRGSSMLEVEEPHQRVLTRREEALPDYAERREALRRLGPELEW